MSKVVYLMGAGASRGVRGNNSPDKDDFVDILEGLPIVNEIPVRMRKVAELFSEFDFGEDIIYVKSDVPVNLLEARKNLLEGFDWLISNINGRTVDQFARTLYVNGLEEEYKKLKRLLSIFFKTEQIVNRPDSRYVKFLSHVIRRNDAEKLRISDDITVLTWNYDSQFEIAYRDFLSYSQGEDNLDFPENMGVDIHEKDCQTKWGKNKNDDGKRQIFKLNGSASFFSEYSFAHLPRYADGKLPEHLSKSFLWTYDADYHIGTEETKRYCLLHFAWDKQDEEYDRDYMARLDDAVKDAEILVVIGYTFPDYNRDTDMRILSMMGNLKTVFLQDPNAAQLESHVRYVIDGCGIARSVGIKPITATDAFFIPNELLRY